MDPDTREMLERMGRDKEAGRKAAERERLPLLPAPPTDPLLNSEIDIPLDRIAREFRKRAGRAFGLNQDEKARSLRNLCTLIEQIDDSERSIVSGAAKADR